MISAGKIQKPHTPHSQYPAHPSRRAAFTLLEAMIAIMIGSLVLGACLPAFLNWGTERKLRAPLAELGGMIQRARAEAITRGTTSRLGIGVGGFSREGEQAIMPDGVKLQILKPGTEKWTTPGKDAALRILSTGMCEPWRLEFSAEDGSFLRVAVDPLTGFVNEETSFVQ